MMIPMTREEAEDLYHECLRRQEDTPEGTSVLHKLAEALEFEARAASQAA